MRKVIYSQGGITLIEVLTPEQYRTLRSDPSVTIMGAKRVDKKDESV